MDQKQIGKFLKELRREKGITQEQFAEQIHVSARTVSRWETGSNMPDISLLVAIAEFFDVSIPEIINGERKSENMKEEVREVAEKLSDYAEAEKALLLKRARRLSIAGCAALFAGLAMEAIAPESGIPVYETVKGLFLGVSVGAAVSMVLYTTGVLGKVREKKLKYKNKK